MTSPFLLCLLIVVLSMRSADALHAGVLEFVPKVVTLPASREEAIAMMMGKERVSLRDVWTMLTAARLRIVSCPVNAAKIAGTALAAKAKGIEILVLPEVRSGSAGTPRGAVWPIWKPRVRCTH